MAKDQGSATKKYVGVDVGGTKTLVTITNEAGEILFTHKEPSDPKFGPKKGMAAITRAIEHILEKADLPLKKIKAIGIAIPGVVDPKKGRIVITPNMNLDGTDVRHYLQEAFGKPIALGNDCNCGILGERWLGAARGVKSAVGIFVGTGIGAGFSIENQIWTGRREAAMEIGHMRMTEGGPVCGCGNIGCFETWASRTAMERMIREGVSKGRKTSIIQSSDQEDRVKSGKINKALKKEDKLVMEVVAKASTIIGQACMNVNHLIDPHLIVLGGGMIEACGWFMLPVINEVVTGDPLPGAKKVLPVVEAQLGDDAVALGAIALARQAVGRCPFQ